MRFPIILATALLCSACGSSSSQSKPSDAEIEAGILYHHQFSGEVISFETEGCFHQESSGNQYYKCDVSYRLNSRQYGRVIENAIGLCLKLKSDGVWRHCYAERDYNIVTDNVLTR